MKNTIKLIAGILLCELAGIIGSIFTAPAVKEWFQFINKPNFSPPNWLFAPVWTFLYLLMGISLYLVWSKNFSVDIPEKDKEKKAWNPISTKLFTGSWREENVAAIFLLQLVLNVLWSVIFFGLKSPGVAFFEIIMLWFAILYMIVNFYRVSKISAYLQIPYILWVSFASILNFSIWMLN